VLIAGIDLTELDEDGRAAIRGQACRFCIPVVSSYPVAHAIENVMLPLELGAGATRAKRRRRRLRKWTDAAPGAYPKQLSGGEQQAWRLRAPSDPSRGALCR